MMEKAKELIIAEICAASSLATPQIERKIEQTLASCFKDVKPGLEA
jgi:RNA polymerase-interacting CarD/CdnL/TRCF family regulator